MLINKVPLCSSFKFSIKCVFLPFILCLFKIYKEDLKDLLKTNSKNHGLVIRENVNGSIRIAGTIRPLILTYTVLIIGVVVIIIYMAVKPGSLFATVMTLPRKWRYCSGALLLFSYCQFVTTN